MRIFWYVYMYIHIIGVGSRGAGGPWPSYCLEMGGARESKGAMASSI